MSSETVGWAFRHSPYRGVPFAIHIALADAANDANDYELWMRQTILAKKARTTRKTVNEHLARMIEDGLLQLLQENTGGANRYRMLMPPDCPVFYEQRSGRGAATQGTYKGRKPGTPRGTPVTGGDTSGVTSRDTEPKGLEPKVNEPPAADRSEAHDLVAKFYDWCAETGRPKPTLPQGRNGNQFMALVGIVHGLLTAGWTKPEVKVALTRTPAYTTNALTLQLNQARGGQPPPASGPRGQVDDDRDGPSGVVDL